MSVGCPSYFLLIERGRGEATLYNNVSIMSQLIDIVCQSIQLSCDFVPSNFVKKRDKN